MRSRKLTTHCEEMQHFARVATILEHVKPIQPPRRIFALSLFTLAALFALSACNQPPPREIQDGDYETAELQVRAADRIALVRLESTAVHQVEAFQQGSGESIGTRPITYLVFKAVEPFKGSAAEGDTINVAVEVPGLYEFRPGDETVQFEIGGEYVVFLKGRSRPAGYPQEYGGALWTPNGEPWVAKVVDGERLDFAVSDAYLRLVGDVEVPFTLDLTGLRFLTGD